MFDSVESQADLFRRKFTILTQSVQANDVLDVVGSEWLGFDLWSVIRSILIGLVVSVALLFSISLSIVMIPSLFLLLHLTLMDTQIVLNACVISLNRETRLVLKLNGEIGTEARHSEEVDSGLSDDLLDKDMIGIFIYWFLNLLSFNCFGYLFWFEDIKGKTIVFAESGVNNELVLLIGMCEVYDLITFVINVGRVIIVIFDFLLGCNKFANICS